MNETRTKPEPISNEELPNLIGCCVFISYLGPNQNWRLVKLSEDLAFLEDKVTGYTRSCLKQLLVHPYVPKSGDTNTIPKAEL